MIFAIRNIVFRNVLIAGIVLSPCLDSIAEVNPKCGFKEASTIVVDSRYASISQNDPAFKEFFVNGKSMLCGPISIFAGLQKLLVGAEIQEAPQNDPSLVIRDILPLTGFRGMTSLNLLASFSKLAQEKGLRIKGQKIITPLFYGDYDSKAMQITATGTILITSTKYFYPETIQKLVRDFATRDNTVAILGFDTFNTNKPEDVRKNNLRREHFIIVTGFDKNDFNTFYFTDPIFAQKTRTGRFQRWLKPEVYDSDTSQLIFSDGLPVGNLDSPDAYNYVNMLRSVLLVEVESKK